MIWSTLTLVEHGPLCPHAWCVPESHAVANSHLCFPHPQAKFQPFVQLMPGYRVYPALLAYSCSYPGPLWNPKIHPKPHMVPPVWEEFKRTLPSKAPTVEVHYNKLSKDARWNLHRILEGGCLWFETTMYGYLNRLLGEVFPSGRGFQVCYSPLWCHIGPELTFFSRSILNSHYILINLVGCYKIRYSQHT